MVFKFPFQGTYEAIFIVHTERKIDNLADWTEELLVIDIESHVTQD